MGTITGRLIYSRFYSCLGNTRATENPSDFTAELFGRETPRIESQGLWPDGGFDSFEFRQCGFKARLIRGLIENPSKRLVERDTLENATLTQCNDGLATGQSLECGHSE